MLYAFLLDADPSGCALEEQAEQCFDRNLGAAADQRADCSLELFEQLGAGIDERGLRKLYDEIDFPLAEVLARVEETGIRIDPVELRASPRVMETEIARLTGEIHALAGKDFNITSPQQLGQRAVRGPAPARSRAIRQRQDASPPRRTCWRNWPRIMRSSARCSNTASSRSSKAPTWTPFPR